MSPTTKLYEADPFLQGFTATVLRCTPAPGGQFDLVLDATAFYPEGGGQPADRGTLGGAAVLDVQTDGGGVITHRTDAPLQVGAAVQGRIDWPRRLDHMEQHTGEHILSGVLHRLYGAQNVGFHIGQPAVRMDLDLPLTAAQLAEAERLANDAVRADTPVRCYLPDADTLAHTEYRSKKALEGPVRLVEAGGDCCACCGTHLRATGQVGAIKILSAQKYKGGVRLAVVCGQRAQAAVADAWADAEAAGRLVSAGPGRLAGAVTHLLDSQAADRQSLAALQGTIARLLAGNPGQAACYYLEGADSDGLRRICLAAAGGGFCAALAPGGQGLAYALTAGPQGDARPIARALNERFSGRGGGKAGFCQGSLAVPPEAYTEVEAFLAGYAPPPPANKGGTQP